LEQAPILNLAPEIRRILSSVPLLDNNKNIVYDDLGYKKYINFSTVYEEILQQLSKGMLDSNELIPELEKLVVGKPWVQGVIDLLNESPEFKTKLFTNSFKDSKEYLAIVSSEEKDDAGSKIISLNSSEAAELFYNN